MQTVVAAVGTDCSVGTLACPPIPGIDNAAVVTHQYPITRSKIRTKGLGGGLLEEKTYLD